MIDARDHWGLVKSITGKFVSGPNLCDTEEFADGLVGLAVAIQKFNPTLGNKFSTFAYPCIRNEILKGLVSRGKGGGEDCMTVADLDFADSRQDNSVEVLDFAQHWLRRLPPKMKWVLAERFNGRKFHEIGKDLGVGRERARQIYEEAFL
jgi:RNA polymerase sigma factor (sigma-70 family)